MHPMSSGEDAARADEHDPAAVMDTGNLGMDAFEGGLSLQKTVYLQSFGVCLGCDSGWYMHGTHSPALTRAGFKIRGIKRMP